MNKFAIKLQIRTDDTMEWVGKALEAISYKVGDRYNDLPSDEYFQSVLLERDFFKLMNVFRTVERHEHYGVASTFPKWSSYFGPDGSYVYVSGFTPHPPESFFSMFSILESQLVCEESYLAFKENGDPWLFKSPMADIKTLEEVMTMSPSLTSELEFKLNHG